MGYTEIDGRIDGGKRKYRKSHSADATSVGPRTHTFVRCCVHAGADPGFWERGGLLNIFTTGGGHGRGRAPSRDRKGVLGER